MELTSNQEPLRSKLDRYEAIMKDIGATFKALKAERLSNLKNITSITVDDHGSCFDFSEILNGKIPPIKSIITQIEFCENWNQLRKILAVLREIRFLGSPKRAEISSILLERFATIYENSSSNSGCDRDEELVGCFNILLTFDQMNPLIVPKACAEDATEALKTVIYTAQDISKKIIK